MKKTLFVITAILVCLTGISQPTSFAPRGMGGGGAMFFPSINPYNEDEYYVASDLSAMFHSTDYGKSYDQVDFQKLQVGGNSTYEFTNDPMIAYCNFNDGNDGYPVKTSDGGVTWSRLMAYDVENYGGIYSMKANIYNVSQLLVSAYGDILFSNNGGASFSTVKSADDNGAGLIMGGVFWDGSNIYIGTNDGLIVSNNGGNSFTVMPTTGIPANERIWSFAAAKEGGITKFVCITADVADVYNGVAPWDYYDFAKGVYVMDNVSGLWQSVSTGIDFSADFIMYAAMAYNDIDRIYLGGADDNTGGPLVFKSENGGSTWAKVFNTVNNANIITGWEGHGGDKTWGWSENCFGLTVAPFNSARVMFGNFSNVQLTSDGGLTWRQAYVGQADENPAGQATPKNKPYHSIGLENTTCWQVFWQNASTMMGCYSDIGGIRSVDAGKSWGYQYSGFGVNTVYRMVKDVNGNMFAGCSNIHDMYQSTRLSDALLDANDANGKIVYSTNDGATWATLHSFNHPVFWLATDPNKPNTMYASVIHYGGTQGAQQGGIYKTDNLNALAGSVWTKLPNPPRTEGHPACIEVLNDGKVVCTFSGRRNPQGVFTASSGVFVYDPVLGTWADVSHSSMYYWTKDIIIDPNDPAQNTWYVCVFSGWGGPPNGLGGLFKTTDRGLSWTKLTGTDFDRVTSLTFNPLKLNEAYLTTETQGLWVSQNMNQPIPDWTLVESYPFRQPERVYFNPYNQKEMWVSSFGNGMKVGEITTKADEQIPNNQISGTEIFPNPAGDFVNIRQTNGKQPKKGFIRILNAAGSEMKVVEYNGGTTRVDVSGLIAGVYYCELRDGVHILAGGKFVKE
ncbi:MAG TPA: T9SS type A sorting domain-containing protein [Saprospiraceae bacterium]|nr:T9SS type A sorting domain-containing protein [Saprospiraceae bacterium]MCC6687454.1 T9SS type A sorting domain-containing protein [Saprospiraceae bacterium]HMV22863.1 T9SS type A sorting domain-containing protein [Saprospiraceae bacterium]HMX84441.1 T9SS type A sorting domain-containing protein [Saprospiraceae bacterium]HMZ73048.1 T9SS type A sorting domain-containing protein [Saprospiraceae bacterium]